MSAFLRWYVAVQCLGWLAFAIALPWLARLPDRGYALSKALGVFLLGFLLWSGTSLGLLRNDLGGAALVVLGLAIAAAYRCGARIGEPPSQGAMWPGVRAVVLTEAVFLAAFAGWSLVRFADPAANHTEQPMDLMLLTAVAASPTFPPEDPWLAGYAVGYYYLGYWFLAAVGHLTALTPSVSYNVGQACWFGLLAVTCFGIGSALAGRRGSSAAGLLTAIVVPVAGNLYLITDWLARWWEGSAPGALFSEHWWWFRSARAARDLDLAGRPIELITEFPAFSYVLGDNHPHVLAMPFAALLVGLSFSVFVAGRPRPGGSDPSAAGTPPVQGALIVTALACGALVPLNTWDFPAGLAVLTCAVGLPALAAAGTISAAVARVRELLPIPLVALAAAPVLFLFTAQSQVRGVLPNLFHPTPTGDAAVVFGTLVPGILLLFGAALRDVRLDRGRLLRDVAGGLLACGAWLAAGALWASRTPRGAEWLTALAQGAGAADPFAAALDRWTNGWPLLTLTVAALAVAASALRIRIRDARSDPGLTFGLALLLIGLGAVLVPELAYAHDAFGNRMNTIFKFYYQAWLFLGIASALGIVLAWRLRGAWRIAAVLAFATVAAGCVYLGPAIAHKTRAAGASAGTFDAIDYVRVDAPDAYHAIAWIRSNTPSSARVAQAPGRSYDATHSLISTATGRPTLLGWEGHERQWRGRDFDTMAAGRREALRRIYNPESDRSLAAVLCEWDVEFVYVGSSERTGYSMTPAHDAALGRVLDTVFARGTVRVYRRRDCD